MKHPIWMVIALLVLAGCQAAEGPRVPTAQQPVTAASTSAPASAPAKESDYDKALKYTRCMNDNGIPITDPVVGQPLQTTAIDPNSAVVRDSTGSAWQTEREGFHRCKHLMPATWPVKVDPAQIAKERAFGECLRKHGQQFYEPDADGMVHYPTDMAAWDTPEYRAAENACRHLYDDPANHVDS